MRLTCWPGTVFVPIRQSTGGARRQSWCKPADVLVFMESIHRRFCAKWIDAARQRIEVWEIEDVGPIAPMQIPDKVERTFAVIRQRIDGLLSDLGVGKAGPAS